MGDINTNRITPPALAAGEANFRRIHEDLVRVGHSLANPDEPNPAIVRARLARIVGQKLKEEVQNDPAGRGYAAVPNAQKLALLVEPYQQQYGDVAGYLVVSSTALTRAHQIDVTKIGGAPADLLAAGIPPGTLFKIGITTYSIMQVQDTALIVNMASVLPAAADIVKIFGAQVFPPRLHQILMGIPHAPNSIDIADFADIMA